MVGSYCLTALEAAEMAGIELDEMMLMIANERGVGIQVGDAWRVDPNALHAVVDRGTVLREAA